MKQIVETVPIRKQVTNIIREMIATGELKPDERISERQLSQRLNVSTTPIKEALRVLQTEGLIYTLPRKGSFVTTHSRENLLQIIYLRSAVDGVAAYFAAECATREEIEQMREALAVSQKAIEEKGEIELINSSNDRFHELLREATHNQFIMQLGGTIREIDNSIRRLVNKNDYCEMAGRQIEHEMILQAVQNHESERAEGLMLSHVRVHSSKPLKSK